MLLVIGVFLTAPLAGQNFKMAEACKKPSRKLRRSYRSDNLKTTKNIHIIMFQKVVLTPNLPFFGRFVVPKFHCLKKKKSHGFHWCQTHWSFMWRKKTFALMARMPFCCCLPFHASKSQGETRENFDVEMCRVVGFETTAVTTTTTTTTTKRTKTTTKGLEQ